MTEAEVFVFRATLRGHSDTVTAIATPENNNNFNAIGDTARRFLGQLDWVSCVRFIPDAAPPRLVSASWDGSIRVWDVDVDEGVLRQMFSLSGHEGYVNVVTVSPDASVVASGGEDGVLLLWDMAVRVKIYEFEVGSVVHGLLFSPNRDWMCIATDERVRVWDLETKNIKKDLNVDDDDDDDYNYINDGTEITVNNKDIYCTSMNWGADGNTFLCGYTDGLIRIWEVFS